MAPGTQKSYCGCSPSDEVCDGKDNDCNGVIDDTREADLHCRQQGSGFACHAGSCECAETNQCGGCFNLAIDPLHCGECGNACPSSDSAAPVCAASRCATVETIAPNEGGGPLVFAVDAEHLYMGDFGIGRLDQWSFADGSHFSLADPGGLVFSITTNEGSVFWAATSLKDDQPGGVYRVPIGGGKRVVLATDQRPSFGLGVDETHVYWTAQPPIDQLWLRTGPGQVLRVPKEGGEVTVLAEQQDGPWGLAIDETHVYWTNFESGTVMKQAKTGGEPVVLASGQAGPTSIVVDATSVYWTNVGTIDRTRPSELGSLDPYVLPRTGSVMKVPIEGGTPVVLASEQDTPAWGLAVDAAHVYWTNSQLLFSRTKFGAIMRIPIAGGAPTTLVPEQLHPWGLALANGGIYWSSGELIPPLGSRSNGKVQKLVLRGDD